MSDGSRKIFLSYVLEDRAFAKRLAEAFRGRGIAVVLGADFDPGSPWADALREQIEHSDALVLVIPSQSAANRNSIWFEAGAARVLGKPVLAVLPSKSTAATFDLPTDIAALLILDAENRPLSEVVDTLIQAVPSEGEAVETV